MSRRNIQNAVVWAATLVFLAVAIHQGPVAHYYPGFIIACGVYAVFLALSTLACRFSVRKADRVRPEIPEEFLDIHVGPLSERLSISLAEMKPIRSQAGPSELHRVYETKRSFPNGELVCQFEVAGNRILARYLWFRSRHSVVLDYGAQQGNGLLLRNDPPD